jgi:hypothetical protein
MNRLYDYIFHYNHFTELWSAIPRELYNRYWDNDDIKGTLKSKNINTLIEIITKEIKVR